MEAAVIATADETSVRRIVFSGPEGLRAGGPRAGAPLRLPEVQKIHARKRRTFSRKPSLP